MCADRWEQKIDRTQIKSNWAFILIYLDDAINFLLEKVHGDKNGFDRERALVENQLFCEFWNNYCFGSRVGS